MRRLLGHPSLVIGLGGTALFLAIGLLYPAFISDRAQILETVCRRLIIGRTDARQALIKRSFGAATDRFVKLHSDPRVLEPTRTWAGMQAVVAALLDEDGERAKSLAVAARVHASKVADLDPAIRTILLPLMAQLEEGKSIPIESVDPAASGPAALIASLVIGILEHKSCIFYQR